MSKPSSRTIAPLVLDLRPSRWLQALHALATACALAAIFLTPLSIALYCLATAVVLALAHWARAPHPLRRLVFDRSWMGWTKDDGEVALVLEGAVVWPMLILLRFRALPALTLLPDSIDAAGWRRLRLQLDHGDVFGDQRVL